MVLRPSVVFFFVCFFSVQYVIGVYRYYKEWRKNPHWSFSCCLALLLPLIDFQSEMSGLGETDLLKSQLKSGDMEMPTILIAEEDSGAVNDNLDEKENEDKDFQHGKQSSDGKMVTQQSYFQNTKYDKATQTEFLMPSCKSKEEN